MPWKNGLPEWLQLIATFLAAGWLVLLGTIIRILEDVRVGKRSSFFSVGLVYEIPGIIILAFVAIGIAEFFNFGVNASAALGIVLGWIGPATIKIFISTVIENRGKKK